MTQVAFKSRVEKRYVYPVPLGADEMAALQVIVSKMGCTKAEAIRDAITHYAEYVKGLEIIKIRNMPRKQAREEIVKYLEKADHAWSGEIADALRLDLELVNRILEELWSEDKVEPTAK